MSNFDIGRSTHSNAAGGSIQRLAVMMGMALPAAAAYAQASALSQAVPTSENMEAATPFSYARRYRLNGRRWKSER
ncbi:MAG: hypothetical protein WBY88_14825 [Desulfosarcina sp.]